jgi:carboxymethylenebutenolidase
MSQIEIKSDGRSLPAYLSKHPGGTRKVPGIVAIQQIFGVTREMKDFTDAFALRGYIAVCPDLYWRIESGLAIDPMASGAHERAIAYGRKFDVEAGIEDLRATIEFLRHHPDCDGTVGTVGYCLGGLMAFLLSARGEGDCHVGYFGTRIDKHIGEAAHLSRPLLLHIPEQDRFVPPAAQEIIRKHLEGKAEIYTYPNADHAFNRIGAESYNAEVTALADQRTESFLKRHLAT